MFDFFLPKNCIWNIFKHTEKLKEFYNKQLHTHYLDSAINSLMYLFY